MQYEVSFGTLACRDPAAGGDPSKTFRLAVMGDFSGRPNAGLGSDAAPAESGLDDLDARLASLS